MLNVVIDDLSRDAEKRRLERLEAMLEMFEEDRGQPATTMEELREWMGAQALELQTRMIRHLHMLPDTPSEGAAQSYQALCKAHSSVDAFGALPDKPQWMLSS